MTEPTAFARRAAVAVTLLAALLGGCAQLRIAAGPRMGEPVAPPAALGPELETRDHRGRDRLRFAVVGDTGTGGRDQRRVGEAIDRACRAAGGCDFALVTGDLIYPTGVRSYTDRWDRQFETKFESPYRRFGRFDFWLVAGNHDWYRRGSTRTEIAYSRASERWRMPAHDFAIPALPAWISIYGVDTTLLLETRRTGQLDRARDVLCAQGGWSFLFSHHPVYTAGHHGDGSGTIQPIEAALLPLIRRCRVQLLFSGHDHLQAHIRSPAFDQIIQGAGGRALHKTRAKRRPAGVEVLAVEDGAFGFALVETTAETLRVSFHDLSHDGPSYCRVVHRETFFDGVRSSECADRRPAAARAAEADGRAASERIH